MCEHNMVIGKQYKLTLGRYNCFSCRNTFPMGFEARYLGDYEPDLHCFIPIGQYSCKCGSNIVAISYDCREGSGGAIDVTQEFLSLPVRSRE